MLLGDSGGNKYPPFVVLKAARSKNDEQQAEKDIHRHGFGRHMWRVILQAPTSAHLQIYGNTKGWWNERLSLEFLKHRFGGRSAIDPLVILLWDDMSAHWTKDMKQYTTSQHIELLRVPPRFTFYCQPADVAWNKPLKDRLRAAWIDQLRVSIRNNEKIIAPRRNDVMQWLMEAWSALSSQTIISDFKKCRLLEKSANDEDGAADDEETCAEVVTAGGLIDALAALRVLESGHVRDEDDIKASNYCNDELR